jgi:hypothetical protein
MKNAVDPIITANKSTVLDIVRELEERLLDLEGNHLHHVEGGFYTVKSDLSLQSMRLQEKISSFINKIKLNDLKMTVLDYDELETDVEISTSLFFCAVHRKQIDYVLEQQNLRN